MSCCQSSGRRPRPAWQMTKEKSRVSRQHGLVAARHHDGREMERDEQDTQLLPPTPQQWLALIVRVPLYLELDMMLMIISQTSTSTLRCRSTTVRPLPTLHSNRRQLKRPMALILTSNRCRCEQVPLQVLPLDPPHCLDLLRLRRADSRCSGLRRLQD